MMLVVVAEGEEPDPVALTAVFEGAAQLLALFFSWMYFALMESSRLQATLGKLALRMRITDLAGDRVGFEKGDLALLRQVRLGAAAARRLPHGGVQRPGRQALHDRMAGCLVVSRHQPPPSDEPADEPE